MPTQHDPEGFESKYLYDVADLSGAHALEIGCGDGRLIWHYAASARHVTGIDPNPQRLATAQGECPPALRPNITFIRAGAEALPFCRETFDLAILAWSL